MQPPKILTYASDPRALIHAKRSPLYSHNSNNSISTTESGVSQITIEHVRNEYGLAVRETIVLASASGEGCGREGLDGHQEVSVWEEDSDDDEGMGKGKGGFWKRFSGMSGRRARSESLNPASPIQRPKSELGTVYMNGAPYVNKHKFSAPEETNSGFLCGLFGGNKGNDEEQGDGGEKGEEKGRMKRMGSWFRKKREERELRRILTKTLS